MAFRVRTDSLHHSPRWYDLNCREEDGGSPAFRAMLTADMRFIGADIDSKMSYMERVGTYEERWDEVMADPKEHVLLAAIADVLDREGWSGDAEEVFTKEPFRTFDRLIAKHDISHDMVREFLKWRAKQENAKKARKVKDDAEAKRKAFCERLSKRTPALDNFLDTP